MAPAFAGLCHIFEIGQRRRARADGLEGRRASLLHNRPRRPRPCFRCARRPAPRPPPASSAVPHEVVGQGLRCAE